jgi:hypothetical protein
VSAILNLLRSGLGLNAAGSKRLARCVALHGPSNGRFDAEAALEWFDVAVKNLGLDARNWIAVTKQTGPRSSRREFRLAEGDLGRAHLKDSGSISWVEVAKQADLPGCNRLDNWAWYGSCSSQSLIELFVDSTQVTIDRTRLISFAKLAFDLGAFDYGYLFELGVEDGPGNFSRGYGFNFSGSVFSVEEQRRIQSWGEFCRAGYGDATFVIRDVFPVNFLHDGRLNANVAEGRTLRDWIGTGGGKRGSVTKLTDEIWMWEVPDKSLADLRRELSGSEAMFYPRAA